MPKPKSEKWARNYERGKLNWWMEEDHVWNQHSRIEDGDEGVISLEVLDREIFFKGHGAEPKQKTRQLPNPASNWQCHLKELRNERERIDDRLRNNTPKRIISDALDRIENYKVFAKKRGISDIRVRQVVREITAEITSSTIMREHWVRELEDVEKRTKQLEDATIAHERIERDTAHKLMKKGQPLNHQPKMQMAQPPLPKTVVKPFWSGLDYDVDKDIGYTIDEATDILLERKAQRERNRKK
tara:strand:- start:82 stop:810 length:729 start_codon:yes stop_codon:yes gene_type:complete